MDNIINLEEIVLDMGEAKRYKLNAKGKVYEFELNLDSMCKIEEKLGITIEELFLKMFIEDMTYNYLIDLIDCILDLEGENSLRKTMRFTQKNLKQLDEIALSMAYEYCPENIINYIATNTINNLQSLDKIE